jgi:rod shape-determining protein MreD
MRGLYWIFVIAFQVFILNHLDLSVYLVPQAFILLLIGLNLGHSRIIQIIVAASLGLLIDLFTATPGIHTSACLWLIVIRMRLLSNQDLKEHITNKRPYNISVTTTSQYLYTLVTLVLFYHLYIFWLESIGAVNPLKLLSTVLFSSTLALMIIGIFEYLSISKSRV